MSYLDSLGIQLGDCVAFVGAGGKTSLAYRLVREIESSGHRALFTTTTKIWKPQEGVFDVFTLGDVSSHKNLRQTNWRTACIARLIEGEANEQIVANSIMPVVQTKLIGFTPDQVCELHSSLVNSHSSIITLVEADGARGLRLKAPAHNEPQIPQCANVVCVLASLDAIGRSLDDRIAHRAGQIAQLTRTMPGSIITAQLLIELLSHIEGGKKNIPDGAKCIAVLTQFDDQALHPDASEVTQSLLQNGFVRVVTVSNKSGSIFQ
jgi:probable selenium-dependent hydroxylase accessory protein YqeC